MFSSVQQRRDLVADAAIDIAPLIDVVFILLIFFLVTATFTRDAGVDIERPRAAVTRAVESDVVRVHLAASGDLYVEGQRVSADQMRERLKARTAGSRAKAVVIVPDRSASAGRLIEVMDAARLAGVEDVVVAAEPVRGK